MTTTSPPNMQAQINDIHAAFCAATGFQLRMGLGEYTREAAWVRFLNAGFTKADMLLVVRHLKRKVHEGTRNIGALRFSNLVERLDSFEEERGMALAEQRNTKPPMTPKERVLQQARPTVTMNHDTTNTAKPVSHWIAQLRSAAQ